MPSIDLEGADRITVGTSDTTMRIWLLLDQAGEVGLSADDIHALVGPHVNAGYARRRYLKRRQRAVKHNFDARAARASEPTWETTGVERARHYVITQTLSNMRRWGTTIVGGDGRYRAGRQPTFQRDVSIIDLNGDRTRIHMNTANALRVLEPAAARIRQSSRAQLNRREKEALLRLIDLAKESLQRQDRT